MNAFIVAGTNSGVGKTTVTLSLISALKQLGFSVQPFKVGPDFIDPGYHTIASGNTSVNLDSWMLSKEYNIHNFHINSKDKDIAIVEGVMGFYDGFSTTEDFGSSAEISKILKLPVILIVNGKSLARSAAAIVLGFEKFDANVDIKGIIFNNVSGESHYEYLKESVEHYCNAQPIGYFKKGDFESLPSRHLGLVTVQDNPNIEKLLDGYGKIALKRLNTDKLLELTRYNHSYEVKQTKKTIKKKVKVAVARDNAFCFYYHDNLKKLCEYGAEITFFSPLKDEKIPDGSQLIYLGGGYPELYAKQLSENVSMMLSIKNFSDNYGYIYAECGGFIYLTKGVHTKEGKFFPFTGIFNEEAVMLNRLKTLGYTEIETKTDAFWGKSSIKARGHEFHYSFLKNNGENLDKIYSVKMRKKSQSKEEGYIYKNTLGSYIHLHFGSNPRLLSSLFENFN